MKKNIRVAVPFNRDLRDDGRISLVYPAAISLVCHAVFLVLFVVTPGLHPEKPPARSVINVSMVSFKDSAPAPDAKPVVEKKVSAIEKPEVAKEPTPVPPARKPAAVVDKPQPKPKTSLKKKTFKATEVVKQAIKQMEEKVEVQPDTQTPAAQPEPLKTALDRLRQEVNKAESDKANTVGSADARAGGEKSTKFGRFNESGKQTAELIDLYRLEIAFQIQKQWAFNEQLAGDRSLVAAIVFKVMPDGAIRDIFFTDRSGNDYLDESAYKAIVKSNPVDSHPKGLTQPYVVMAIRFTPQGIR